MKTILLGYLVTSGLIAVSGAATAQTTILDYQGSPYITVTTAGAVGLAVSYSIGESLSGFITLSSPLGDNLNNAVVTPTSGGFNDGALNLPLSIEQSSIFSFSTDSNGSITGWAFSFNDGAPGPGAYQHNVTSSIGGDSVSFSASTHIPDCEHLPAGCFGSTTASSSVPGQWTAVRAPEIDPASAVTGLMLLLGSLAVLRGGRRENAITV